MNFKEVTNMINKRSKLTYNLFLIRSMLLCGEYKKGINKLIRLLNKKDNKLLLIENNEINIIGALIDDKFYNENQKMWRISRIIEEIENYQVIKIMKLKRFLERGS